MRSTQSPTAFGFRGLDTADVRIKKIMPILTIRALALGLFILSLSGFASETYLYYVLVGSRGSESVLLHEEKVGNGVVLSGYVDTYVSHFLPLYLAIFAFACVLYFYPETFARILTWKLKNTEPDR